jgi:hypothetical protein
VTAATKTDVGSTKSVQRPADAKHKTSNDTTQ